MSPNDTSFSTRLILGVPVAQVTYEKALDLVRQWVCEPAQPRCRTVAAANVHVVTEAALHADFAGAVRNADLVLPDGMPLVWAGRMLGSRLADRCYGPTLMEKALDRFRPACSHYLYGSTQSTLNDLVVAIQRRWPGVRIVGAVSPPFGPFDDRVEEANIAAINASGADILWIGMGCPKQELWMHRYRDRLNVKVVLAVGAAFDFIAGRVPQAPRWMQQAGLEWAFRLWAEPKRLWRRYLFRNPYFVAQFGLQLCGLRWRNRDESR
jgi:N-acetylglucosaminyldiphosphoundecaprenol N-acetyl-beta-D-mannosaminyltransferase